MGELSLSHKHIVCRSVFYLLCCNSLHIAKDYFEFSSRCHYLLNWYIFLSIPTVIIDVFLSWKDVAFHDIFNLEEHTFSLTSMLRNRTSAGQAMAFNSILIGTM